MAFEVIDPLPVSIYMEAHLPDHVVFMKSGACGLDFDDPALRSAGGQLITLRRFSEDRTASEKNDGTETTAVTSINSTKDVAILCSRKRVRHVNDALLNALATQDQDIVTQEIGRQMAYYWGKESERFLMQVLTGLFDATSGSLRTTHRYSIAAKTGTKAPASYASIVDAASLLGDNMNDFRTLVLHPVQWSALKKENAARLSTAIVLSEDGSPLEVPLYDGKFVYLSEQFAVDTGNTNKIYSGFLLRDSSMVIAPRRQMKIVLAPLPKIPADIITEVFDFAPHVYGTAWQSAYPSGGPAESDLYTPGNWAKSANVQDKEIGVIKIETN